MNAAPTQPEGPTPVRIPRRGVSAGVASVALVGILAVVIGISLVAGNGEGPSSSPPAVLVTGAPATGSMPGAHRTSTPASTFLLEPPSGLAIELHPGPALATGSTALPDVAGAIPADDGAPPLPPGVTTGAPNPDRLDFLFQLCGDDCYRDAHWIDPGNPLLGSGVWSAGRPFHVREGFVNEREEPLGDGYDVVLYVTRLDSDAVEPTYRYTSDYVLRGTSDRCGPNYATQTRPRTCEWFVHDFPEGLPEGRFAIWAVWQAPCRAWVDYGMISWCDDPDQVMALFSSGFDAPYGDWDPDYTEESS